MDKDTLIGKRIQIQDSGDMGINSEMRNYIGSMKGVRELVLVRRTKAGLALVKDVIANKEFTVPFKCIQPMDKEQAIREAEELLKTIKDLNDLGKPLEIYLPKPIINKDGHDGN